MTSIPRLTLGDWLRKARTDAGFTQAEVADALRVSRPVVTGWELDRNAPDVVKFAILCSLYDAPWLIEVLRQMASDDQSAPPCQDRPTAGHTPARSSVDGVSQV